MNNQNNNNFDSSFNNSKKTPPKDLLTLSSTTPKKASVSSNKTSNISGKFIISNNELNNLNTTVVNNNSNLNNNTNNNLNNAISNQMQKPNAFVNANTTQQSVEEIPKASGKFITEPEEKKSSVKNININTNSIFNMPNKKMNLNSNNSTYPNYNNQQNNQINNQVNNQQINQQPNEQEKMNMLMGKKVDSNAGDSGMSVVDLMKESYIPLVDLEQRTKRENKVFFGILIGKKLYKVRKTKTNELLELYDYNSKSDKNS